MVNPRMFAHFAGPNGVRPRASAAGPYTFGCGFAALRYPLALHTFHKAERMRHAR